MKGLRVMVERGEKVSCEGWLRGLVERMHLVDALRGCVITSFESWITRISRRAGVVFTVWVADDGFSCVRHNRHRGEA